MMQIMQPLTDNILGVVLQGKVTAAEVRLLTQKAEELLRDHDKIRLYMEIVDFKGYTLSGFLQDLKSTMKHLNDFEKVAVVTRQEWLGQLGEVSDILLKAEIRYFDLQEKNLGRQWITS